LKAFIISNFEGLTAKLTIPRLCLTSIMFDIAPLRRILIGVGSRCKPHLEVRTMAAMRERKG
jgi:hypothetical protein